MNQGKDEINQDFAGHFIKDNNLYDQSKHEINKNILINQQKDLQIKNNQLSGFPKISRSTLKSLKENISKIQVRFY